ncbi:hypothetical protein PT974_06860 [Cladobotryum mycophilum]|uniref:Uncharacterized protein n=1 Tax=Cladobotryum mycophilum TaxID=491253 RepID=A0ABR0SMN4_9HYPO
MAASIAVEPVYITFNKDKRPVIVRPKGKPTTNDNAERPVIVRDDPKTK